VLAAVGGYVGCTSSSARNRNHALGDAGRRHRFKYGSIGAENDAGIPYWIFYVLHGCFPTSCPARAATRRSACPWEQAGTAGGLHEKSDRVSACREQLRRVPQHAAAAPPSTPRPSSSRRDPVRRRTSKDSFRFFVDCAKDPRFTPDNVLWEIMNVTELSWLDKAIYRFLIIPITKKRLLEREQQFAWVYHAAFPEVGARVARRRDEPDQVLHC
jgi:hypothetical protein